MEELKKHSPFLALIVLLAVFKFVVIPVFDWQSDTLLKIKLLQKKQNKIDKLISNQKEVKTDNSKITKTVEKYNALFFPQQEESTFKLQKQKIIEELLTKHNITATNVGWEVAKEYANVLVKSYQLRIRFSGTTYDVIALMLALEMNAQLIGISDCNLAVRGQAENSAGFITGRFTLQLYVNNEAVQ